LRVSGLLLSNGVTYPLKGGEAMTVYETFMLVFTSGLLLVGLIGLFIVIVKNTKK
jgi:hypothetical protein